MNRPFSVDADSHVLEPPDLWEQSLEPRSRDRGIHIRSTPEGEELVADGDVILKGRLAGAGWYEPGKESNLVFSFGLGGGTMQLIPAVSSLVCDGLFDRFPRLKVLVVEAGAGFAAYIMDRLDEKYDRFSHIVAMAEVHAAPAGMSERRRNLVLGENARKLFDLR